MTEAQTALSHRAVACKGWRWMPGMPTSNGGRVFAVDEDGSCRLDFGAEEVPFWCTPETMRKMTPDLTDPATLGCLLALVREAHGQSTLSPVSRGLRRWCLADYGTTALEGETEIELLVAALEAAP